LSHNYPTHDPQENPARVCVPRASSLPRSAGASLVAGVILNLKVNGMASDIQRVDGYTAGKESDRKNYEALGWVSYGVGAACVATGAVLYYLGLRAGSARSTSVALVPAFAPGQAGAVLKGAF